MPIPGEDPLKVLKHERFALAVAQGQSLKDAHVAAGYDGCHRRGPYQVKNRPGVNERIDFLRKRIEDQAVTAGAVSRDEVVEGIRENLRAAKKGNAVIGRDNRPARTYEKGEDGVEVEVDVTKRDFAACNKSLELLGRASGTFLEAGNDENFDADIDGMSPDDIQVFLRGLLDSLDPNMRKKFTESLVTESDEEPDEDETPDAGPILQ